VHPNAPTVQAAKPPHAFPFFILHIFFSVFLQFRVPNAQAASSRPLDASHLCHASVLFWLLIFDRSFFRSLSHSYFYIRCSYFAMDEEQALLNQQSSIIIHAEYQ
jgi:hypothetical protein